MNNSNVLLLVEQILVWKKARMSFYADDIINMMIDHNLININDVINITEELKTKEKQAKLPKNHMV